MKYLLVILVAAIPLTWLTASSLKDALWGDKSASGAAQPLNAQKIQELIDQTSNLADEDKTLLDQLNAAVVTPYRTDKTVSGVNVSPASQELAKLWLAFRKAHGLVERVAEVSEFDTGQIPTEIDEQWLTNRRAGADKLDQSLEQLAERRVQLSEVEGLLQEEDIKQLAGVPDLTRVLGTNLQEIGDLVVRLELMKANLGHLEKADQAHRERQYVLCVTELDQWQGPRPELVDLLRQQAVFREQVTRLLASAAALRKTTPTTEWEKVIEEFRRFLGETPQAPTGPTAPTSLAQNQAALELLKRELVRLTSIVRVQQLGPPTDLALWLDKAQAILNELGGSSTDGRAAREALSSTLTSWLNSQLGKKSTLLKGFQYAKTSTGTVMEGMFEPYSVDSYKFVSRKKPAGSPAEIYTKKTIPNPPTPPPTETAVSEYNREVENVQAKLSNKAWWSSFRDKCQKWDESLADYEKQVGSEMDVNFGPLQRVAETMLGKWDIVANILGLQS